MPTLSIHGGFIKNFITRLLSESLIFPSKLIGSSATQIASYLIIISHSDSLFFIDKESEFSTKNKDLSELNCVSIYAFSICH